METISLKPLSPDEFIEVIRPTKPADIEVYTAFFKPYIESFADFAIGKYFWFIADNYRGRLIDISESVSELSPHTRHEWLNPEDPALHFAGFMHPEDREFIFAASQFSMVIDAQLHPENTNAKVCIYARFLNAQHEYQWMLAQILKYYYDEEGICQAALMTYTDISHLPINMSPIMTIMTNRENEKQYFKVIPEKRVLLQLDVPRITKREKLILKLMARGLKTPEIVAELGIAYNTVENHKRNLRAKTNTKTAAELINFVIKNHLL